ncbi:MAG TPA: hybrid sensor histidine kinase/response regulator [Polyangiaceae bacterium]
MSKQEQTPKFLVVDDNAQNRALAQAALEDEGFDVVLATTGEEALEEVQRTAFDCVLLDINMPGMGGLAACRAIRALAQGQDLPIVVLTALRDVDTFDQALKAGADDFLTKPIHPTALVVRMKSALRLRRMSSELRDHYEIVRHQRDELMRLSLLQERLTAFVVHDLKNPVNVIDLHAQLLLRQKDISDSTKNSVHQIRDEVRALMRLILNLLDISKAEEGRLVPKAARIDVDELCTRVCDAVGVRASGANVALTCRLDAREVTADPDLFRRVLENLVDNALRYAPSGSEVAVTSRVAGEQFELCVSDTGRGVPEDLRAMIFERFYQVQATANEQRTSRGLGLAFCKLAIEAHGGQITLEPSSQGALFCVRIPHQRA